MSSIFKAIRHALRTGVGHIKLRATTFSYVRGNTIGDRFELVA